VPPISLSLRAIRAARIGCDAGWIVEPAAEVPLPPLPQTLAKPFRLGTLAGRRPGEPVQLIGDLAQICVHLMRVQSSPPPGEADGPDLPRLDPLRRLVAACRHLDHRTLTT
jgi:hypothetical protein